MTDDNISIDQELFQLTEEEKEQIGRSKFQIIKARIASFIYAIVLLINAVIESYIGSYGLRFYILVSCTLLFFGISLSAGKFPRMSLSIASLIAVFFMFRHIFLVDEPGLANIAWTGILILVLLIGLMHALKIQRIRGSR
jgi:hypothetical protein